MFLVCPLPLLQKQNQPLVTDPGVLYKRTMYHLKDVHGYLLFTLFTGVGYQFELKRSVITDVN